MQWDSGPNAGFCPPHVQPWLPLAPDYQQVNVARELEVHSSMLSMTRRVLELRRETAALNIGSYRAIGSTDQNCFLFLREHEDVRRLVALNFSAGDQQVPLDGYRGSILVSTHVDREDEECAGELSLRPYEGVILRV